MKRLTLFLLTAAAAAAIGASVHAQAVPELTFDGNVAPPAYSWRPRAAKSWRTISPTHCCGRCGTPPSAEPEAVLASAARFL